MPDLSTLIAALESATGPDWKLDERQAASLSAGPGLAYTRARTPALALCLAAAKIARVP